jgi:large conductance mechanosensitive channel
VAPLRRSFFDFSLEGWNMSLLQEFKAFAMRGNVIDLAIGVIIGGAFQKIVTSLIENVLMPIISLVGGGKVDVKELWNVGGIKIGALAQTIIDFLLIAICLFVMIKIMNSAKAKMEKQAEAAPPAPPPEDTMLLREIRDALAKSAPRRAE